MTSMSVSEARAGLVSAGITGPHRSHPRLKNLEKIRAMLADDIEARFGLTGIDRYSAQEVLSFVGQLTGCSTDIADVESEDAIDPDRTIDAILAAARRLAAEAGRGGSLLVATGHPTGLLEHHMRVADAYRRAGGKLIRPMEGERFSIGNRRDIQLRYVGGVGCLSDWGNLRHTHSSEAMEIVLDSGGEWPDVVLGDHGFAGAAIERGVVTIAVMDINDPALAVAWAEGKDVMIVPMDDNRPPRLYEPSWLLFEQVLAGEMS
jgi:hypothetical protein